VFLLRFILFICLPFVIFNNYSHRNLTNKIILNRMTSVFLKTLSFFLMIFLIVTKINAQNNSIAIIVKPKYDAVRFFTENRSAVSIGQKKQLGLALTTIYKWGFVDKNGVEVVPCKYDKVNDFHEGMAKVSLNGKFGYVDKSGKVIIPLKYDEISILATQNDFHEGLAAVCVNMKFGFIDKSGKVIIPLKYGAVGDFHEGIAVGILKHNNDYGERLLIEKTGREIRLKNQYNNISDFKNGMAEVWWEGSQKWGCINKKGDEIIPVIYGTRKSPDGKKFYEELAAVINYDMGKWGYIDKAGKEIVPMKYDHAYDFHEGTAMVESNNLIGFIDKTGKEITPIKYHLNSNDFHEGFAAILDGDLGWGFIDKSGKEVVPCKYDDLRDYSEGMAQFRFKSSIKWGFIDKNGVEVVPCKYDYLHDFREGIAAVSLNGKWGFIDKFGKEIIPPIYENVNDFNEGYASVKLDGFWSLINNKGVIVFPKLADQDIYHYIKDRGNISALEFKNGIIMIGSNGKRGFAGIKIK